MLVLDGTAQPGLRQALLEAGASVAGIELPCGYDEVVLAALAARWSIGGYAISRRSQLRKIVRTADRTRKAAHFSRKLVQCIKPPG